MMPHVKTTEDRSTLPDLYGEVKAIFGAKGEILAGIKNESQYGGVVDQRIINHRFKFSIKRKNREEGVSPAFAECPVREDGDDCEKGIR